MKTTICAMAGTFLMTLTSIAAAQPARSTPTVTGHLQGYSCMMLNLSTEQMRDFDNLPPVMEQPAQGARRIGVASANMIVASPPREVNGYLQVLHLDGRPGWVEARMLKPWANVSQPTTRCIPAMMSDNKPGFTFQRPAR